MPWRRFNRGQLGPLWLLWCRNFWRRRLSQPALLEAARRGRRMVVQLRQRVHVLPWSLFLYAEGTDAEVKAQFHTHAVLVQGAIRSAWEGKPIKVQAFSYRRTPQLGFSF